MAVATAGTSTATGTGLYRLELFVQATAAKDTRSRLMLNNVMRDVTLPVGVLWKAVKKLSAFL